MIWIIEKRTPTGELDFSAPQPEDSFGHGAITGISEDAMAKVIFARFPDAVLTGANISEWPRLLNANFVARRRTWS